jgi:hypothetical protein
MGKGKRYIKRSADGRFFLHIEEPEYSIEPIKKSKLWLSSPYLLEESLKQNPENTIATLDYLIKWNEINQNFEICSELLSLRNNIK